MKITILSSTLSENALGRAYILAKALKKNYEIEFIGLVNEKGIWPPCDTGEFSYKSIRKTNFIKNSFEIYRHMTGDVIYAIKPLPTSFGVGIIKKLVGRKPLVLDFDDWELGFITQDWKDKKVPVLKFIKSYISLALLERMVFLADYITTVSRFLNKKIANRGVFIPHGRDVKQFDPKAFDPMKIKDQLGLTEFKVVMFLGTAGSHKGIEEIIAAVRILNENNIKIVLIGVNNKDSWLKSLIDKNKDIIIPFSFIKFDQIPKYLSAADVVVIPQQKNLKTAGQIPAKIFDAMSMEKPIVSTRVSDIPSILKNCGMVTDPGDVGQLASSIQYILENPSEAAKLGKRAREKCQQEYSLEVMESRLKKIFDNFLPS